MDAVLIESDASKLARAASDIAAVAAVGYLSGAKLHLTKASLDITPAIPLASLTAAEANFTGYAATAIVWDVPGFSTDNKVEVVSVPIIFRPTDGVTPNSVFACWISNSGGTVWYFAGVLNPSPVPLPDGSHQLILTIRYRPATDSLAVSLS
jgi:hypothetical protein